MIAIVKILHRMVKLEASKPPEGKYGTFRRSTDNQPANKKDHV